MAKQTAAGRAGNAAWGGVFAEKFGDIYQKMHIEKRKIIHIARGAPVPRPARKKVIYI